MRTIGTCHIGDIHDLLVTLANKGFEFVSDHGFTVVLTSTIENDNASEVPTEMFTLNREAGITMVDVLNAMESRWGGEFDQWAVAVSYTYPLWSTQPLLVLAFDGTSVDASDPDACDEAGIKGISMVSIRRALHGIVD